MYCILLLLHCQQCRTATVVAYLGLRLCYLTLAVCLGLPESESAEVFPAWLSIAYIC